MQALVHIFEKGGPTIIPIVVFSLVVWGVVFERFFRLKNLRQLQKEFHLHAMSAMLRDGESGLEKLIRSHPELPNAQVLSAALDRLHAKDARLRSKWKEALERKRLLVNQDLKRRLWILGTIAAMSPFVGLLGTVFGVLQSFGDIARTGAGGFAVVAAGVSEALIATAAGLVVAIVAAIAYNVFQTMVSHLVIALRLQLEEVVELLEQTPGVEKDRA